MRYKIFKNNNFETLTLLTEIDVTDSGDVKWLKRDFWIETELNHLSSIELVDDENPQGIFDIKNVNHLRTLPAIFHGTYLWCEAADEPPRQFSELTSKISPIKIKNTNSPDFRELTKGNQLSWDAFVIELQSNILPLYQKHETTFDRYLVHSRLHICRAVIFGEVMARHYLSLGAILNINSIRIAIAFHDSGREDNGIDYWETQSANNCFTYLSRQPEHAEKPADTREVANWILKYDDRDLHHSIVQDADVLEIMRPCCGHGGIAGFRSQHLRFASSSDPMIDMHSEPDRLRDKLIKESWKFISETEDLKRSFNSASYMEELLNILSKHKSMYPILSCIIV